MIVGLKPVSTAHAGTIAELFRSSFIDAFGHLYAPDDLAAFLSEKTSTAFANEIADPADAFRLAVVDDRVAGYIKLGPPALPVETPAGSIELRQLYVGRKWHGAGVAHQLMAWALDEACRRGADHMQLSVFVDNHRALRFYAGYGFVAVGRYGFKVGNHVDEDIVMRRRLSEPVA